MHRMRCQLLPASLALLFALAWARAEDALVLHLPFDGDLGTPIETREIDFAPGRLGQCGHVSFPQGKISKPAGALSYDVSKLMDPRKGTLSFWVKTAKDFGPKEVFGRIMHVTSEEEAYFYTWLRVSVKGKNDFTFQLFDIDAQQHGVNYTNGLETWKADQWHHVALVWHCLKGVRMYDNGEEIYSNWGGDKWEPLTPTLLGFGMVPGKKPQAEFWFDEARLYTEPLSAEQVGALARGQDVRVEKKAEEFSGILSGNPGERLKAEVGDQQGLPVVELGKPMTLKQHLIKSANVRKVTKGALYDGEFKSKRPVAGPVEVEFASRVRITHVALDGPNCASTIGMVDVPETRNARVKLPRLLDAERIRLEPAGDGPLLQEVRCYELREGWSDRQVPTIELKPLAGRRHHLRWLPDTDEVGIAALTLNLPLQPPLPTLARFEVTEESEQSKALFAADVRLTQSTISNPQSTIRLTLDWPDYILRNRSSLIVTLTFDRATQLGEGGEISLAPATVDEARDEYVIRQLGWFAPWYSQHAEAHRWDSANWDPKSMPELRWLHNARELDPDNPLAIAYYNRIFHHSREVEVTLPGPVEAPLWARAQREAMKRTAVVVHWWIDHRQTEDGQFGGGWNDDVEMLHGWDLLVLGAGDNKVKQAMAKLCDGMWDAGLFTRGYSNRIWDVEHAAEDSTYSQPRMVPVDYGNPKWLERCMEATSNFDFWTEINQHGHRHFKGYMFQAQKFRDTPETDSDVPDNARAAKIGLYVIWYNGNEYARKLYRQWADAWVEDSMKAVEGKPKGVLPGEIIAATCQIGREGSKWSECKRYPLGAITYHMEDQLVGTYHFTGDAKYLEPLKAQVRTGRASEAGQVNWRRLTGSTRFDDKFIGKAKAGAATPSFNAWLATRDKQYLSNALTEVVRDFERNRFLITEAEPPTDRVPLPGNVLLREMILGGIGVWVCGWPQMAVSWEQTGYEFAALVLDAQPKQLKVLCYNFGPQREVAMRVWELERGMYELRLGPDRDQDEAMDEVATTLHLFIGRATRVPIELPANDLTVIELQQLEARPVGKRPDLAISAEDVKLSDDRRTVAVTVHNLGSAPAREAPVAVQTVGGKTLGTAKVAQLQPPDDLVAKTVELKIELDRPAPAKWRVAIDPDDTVDEITEENNVLLR